MNRKYLCFILSLLLLFTQLYAATKEPLLRLNGVTYEPLHRPLLIDESLYLSLQDVLSITYGSYDEISHTLSVGSSKITFTPNSRFVTKDYTTELLPHPVVFENETFYLPLGLLDLLNYPYSFDQVTDTLTLTSRIPYSLTDFYKDHTLVKLKEGLIKSQLESLCAPLKINDFLQQAKKNNDYLSYSVPLETSRPLWAHLQPALQTSKPMEITIRELDLLSNTPKSKGLLTLPLKASITNNTLTLTLNEETISTNCLNLTFNPSDSSLQVDINKTLDVMMMRLIYEYYRDHYDLKDDRYFSPITRLASDATDTFRHTVYSDHLATQTHVYDVVIYKQISKDCIRFIVDFIIQ